MANNTESTYPIQSGSNIDFPLSKTVISNQAAKEKIEASFNEIILSEEKFDSEKIKGIYNDLFYQIPKQGKKSHTSIIEQSTDFVYPEININLESSITAKEETLLELNNTYLSGSIPNFEPNHPIYDNGLLVQEGDPVDNAPIEPNSDMWYIQQGFKRKLGRNSAGNVGGYWIRLLRQAEGEEVYDENGHYIHLDNPPNFRYLTPEDLNNIPNGEDIDDGGDLNIKKITDQGDDFIYSEIRIELICEGKEMFYKYQHGEEGHDYDLSEYEHGGLMGGYWWLDENASCKVKIAYPNLSAGWRTIKGGESLTLKISRDDKFYTNNFHGDTNDPLDYEFYNSTNFSTTETRSGYGHALPTMGVWKKWGEGRLFPSILGVEPGSRLNYRLKSPYNSSGQVVDGNGQSHKLQNIIDGEDEAPTQGYPTQANILNSLYDQESNFGTRMINRSCYGPQAAAAGGCYGALGQNSTLQSYFNDPNHPYYHKSNYGQPILKLNNRYAIYDETWRDGLGRDWNYFTYLDGVRDETGDTAAGAISYLWTGGESSVKNKNLDDEVTGYKRDSKKYFDWFIDGSPNPTIYYPGLQGVKLNQERADYNKNDNPFNPKNGGSNYDDSLITPNYNW